MSVLVWLIDKFPAYALPKSPPISPEELYVPRPSVTSILFIEVSRTRTIAEESILPANPPNSLISPGVVVLDWTLKLLTSMESSVVNLFELTMVPARAPPVTIALFSVPINL